MKKVFSIILVLIFALCLLSSCSNKAEESQSLDGFVYVEVLDNEGKPMIEKSKVGFFEGITAYDALKKGWEEKKGPVKGVRVWQHDLCNFHWELIRKRQRTHVRMDFYGKR